jgi:hypothetical protein
MARARLALALPVLFAFAIGACGSDAAPPPPPEVQSIVVITVNIAAGVPELHQIRVAAHLGSAGMDADLYYPPSPGGAIQSGSTLAILIPTSRMGLLDLILYGLDANQTMVARGNGQTTISVGMRVDTTITLSVCGAGGC